jgi:hypothetical protein
MDDVLPIEREEVERVERVQLAGHHPVQLHGLVQVGRRLRLVTQLGPRLAQPVSK